MAVVQTLIGNVKGPKGDTGNTGSTGAQGPAATIAVGTVSTSAYGTSAQVTNSGSSSAAVFDFVIPQGAPGDSVTDMSGLTLNTITAQSAEYPDITAGDLGRVVFGKIKKYLSDLKTGVQASLARKGRLDTGTDLDTITTAGMYYLYASYTYTNAPVTYGDLFVYHGYGSSTLMSQMLVYPVTSPVIYLRSKLSNGNWTSWIKLETTTPTATNITAGTNVSAQTKYCYTMGGSVYIDIIFTVSSSLSTGSNIFTGLPGVPTVGGSGQTVYFAAINRASSAAQVVYVNSSGQLKCSGAMAAGDYILHGVYASELA